MADTTRPRSSWAQIATAVFLAILTLIVTAFVWATLTLAEVALRGVPTEPAATTVELADGNTAECVQAITGLACNFTR